MTTIDLTAEEFWALPPAARYSAFRTLRRSDPFAFFAEPEVPYIEAGPGYFAITRHADIDAISSSPELFCSGKGAVSIPDMPVELVEFYGSMISLDDPRHARIRRIVSLTFTPKMLDQVVDSVSDLARQLLLEARKKAEAGDGTFDFVKEVAAPLPLKVICQMMGIPEADQALVLEQSNIILSGGDPEVLGTDSQDDALGLFLLAGQTLAELMHRLAAERRETPTDDLTSALVNANTDDGDALTDQELGSFFILLCVAGNETTRNAISQGVLAFDQFPEQRQRWIADPALTKSAVEEVVRWATPVTWMRRTATQDVEVGGHTFHEGDKVIMFYGSANRDETVFTDPDTFDVARWPNPHLGFGARGPHFCLGAHLARREIAVAFQSIFELMPDLQVVGEPDRLLSSFVNGIKRMQVRLG
ncbi:MAG: cyp [Frankiales bacterium]|nr:cyp [Frankiales bacterium]